MDKNKFYEACKNEVLLVSGSVQNSVSALDNS